jgi:hypothetical protein
MKRFLIFTALFPPLALFIFIASDPIWLRDFPQTGLLLWMLGYAYFIGAIPAWLAAAADWALSAKPVYLRLAGTMLVAVIFAELTARDLGLDKAVLTFGLMGAIPAAICSWLSGKQNAGTQ